MLASGMFVPVGGSPYYVLPLRLPELTDSTQAGALVDRLLDLPGIDGVKLFTGSWATRDRIVVMPTDVVRAAVEAAHRRGKPVFAHPSNSAGALAALEGGVDVLAHTFPAGPAWDRALPRRMTEAGMALVPTLKLWPWELGRLGVPAVATPSLTVTVAPVSGLLKVSTIVAAGPARGQPPRQREPGDERRNQLHGRAHLAHAARLSGRPRRCRCRQAR
jgi:hypothetical protein